MSRAMWKGNIILGEDQVGVKLHAAAQDRRIHFRMLHDADLAPISQRLENPSTGDVIDYKEAKRGLVISKNHVVLVPDEELAAMEPEPSRDIEVIATLPRQALNHLWFERPYFLTDDKDCDGYIALRQALLESETQVLVRWVMRKQRYRGVVRVEDNVLMLFSLAFADEVVQLPTIQADVNAVSAKEMKLAKQLLEALRGDFNIQDYADTYRKKVLEFVHAKDEGQVITLKKPSHKKPPASIEDALQASLKKVKHGRAG